MSLTFDMQVRKPLESFKKLQSPATLKLQNQKSPQVNLKYTLSLKVLFQNNDYKYIYIYKHTHTHTHLLLFFKLSMRICALKNSF